MDSKKKWEENNEDFIFFFDEKAVEKKRVHINSLEAKQIVNELVLHCKDEELIQRVELLKEYLKTK